MNKRGSAVEDQPSANKSAIEMTIADSYSTAKQDSFKGNPNYVPNQLRFLILILLCAQTAGHALLARYSSGVLKEKYSSSEVVLVAELLKLLVSGYLSVSDRLNNTAGTASSSTNTNSELDSESLGVLRTENSSGGTAVVARRTVTSELGRLLQLIRRSEQTILLVILYGANNILAYFALARVDASIYAVFLQLKILTTAAFASIILQRVFSGAKWRAFLLLIGGCVLVASPSFTGGHLNPTNCNASDASKKNEQADYFRTLQGMGAVLIMVTTSGYSAVYFESLLKVESGGSIWDRNFQLAFWSIVMMVLVMGWEHMSASASASTPLSASATATLAAEPIFFKGWTTCTVGLTIIQAVGGLLVAATLKYADSILKILATAGSIVLAAVVGHWVMDAPLDIFVCTGCFVTIIAIANYTFDVTPA